MKRYTNMMPNQTNIEYEFYDFFPIFLLPSVLLMAIF